jgi:hypothetical protein
MTSGRQRHSGPRAAGALAMALVLALVAGCAEPGPSVAPVGSPATPAPLPTATARPSPGLIVVPATIDATGSTDVTAALQAVIDAAPDGSTIRFRPGSSYLISHAIEITERADLVIDGEGATITLGGDPTLRHRRNLWLVGSTGITITGFTLVGANPAPGVLDRERQFEHGIWVDGSVATHIEGITVVNPYGDCVYVGDRDGRLGWSEGVVVLDMDCHGTGRNGVSVVAGRDVRIEASTFGTIGLHAIDLEPNEQTPPQGADRIAVIGNVVDGPVEDYFFAANGWGPISNLIVTGNVLTGVPLHITVQPIGRSGYIRRAVSITDNRSDTAWDNAENPAFKFRSVIGLTVSGNVAPLAGPGAPMIEVINSCQVTVQDNEFPGGSREWVGASGECPRERA